VSVDASLLALSPPLLAALLLAGGLADRMDAVIRVATFFTLIGTAVAYRRYRRRPDADPFVVIARWSNWGLAGGIFVQLLAVLA
jgi:hypothetical protein